MKSFDEYLAESDRGSGKVHAMTDLVGALKAALDKYDISTRHFVWDHLMTEKGRELMEKIVRNPKTSLSNSEFVKLVEKK